MGSGPDLVERRVGTPKQQPDDKESPNPAAAASEPTDALGDVGGRLRRGDRTRAKILDAAEEAFGRLGYHATSIVEITRGAGVGLGTFYLYFPSKLEIFRQLLRAHVEDFVRTARAATLPVAGKGGDYREVVRKAFGAFFDWIGERPSVLRIMREADFVDASLLPEIYGVPAEEYRKRLERAMELGYVAPTDSEMLAWSLMGMTEFAVMRFLVWPGEKRMDPQRFEAFVDVMIRALGSGQPPGDR